jgi:hypothetical protein
MSSRILASFMAMRASRSRSNWFIPATDAIGSTALLDIVQVAALGGAAAVDAVAGGTPKVASAGRPADFQTYVEGPWESPLRVRSTLAAQALSSFSNKQVASVRALQLMEAVVT